MRKKETKPGQAGYLSGTDTREGRAFFLKALNFIKIKPRAGRAEELPGF
jgi:hypothetical protein